MDKEIAEAMWAGDLDRLHELAPCRCCCHEHTFGQSCPAWQWAGCRGYNPSGLDRREEEQEWLEHYKKFHGMTEEEFYAVDNEQQHSFYAVRENLDL